jgi:hypothetical protein
MAEERDHTIPCSQVDNIAHLKNDIAELKESNRKIFNVIDGNGSGKGMKTDLALVVQKLSKMEEWASSQGEINIEIEVQKRVKDELERKQVVQEDKKIKKFQMRKDLILVIVAIAGLGVAITGLGVSVFLGFRNQNRSLTEFKEEVRSAGVPIKDSRGNIEGVWPWSYIQDSTSIIQ